MTGVLIFCDFKDGDDRELKYPYHPLSTSALDQRSIPTSNPFIQDKIAGKNLLLFFRERMKHGSLNVSEQTLQTESPVKTLPADDLHSFVYGIDAGICHQSFSHEDFIARNVAWSKIQIIGKSQHIFQHHLG